MLILTYILISQVAFFQSMIFTLNSRARQAGNLKRSFLTSLLSNGVWFLMTFIIALPTISEVISGGLPAYHSYLLCLMYAGFSAAGNTLMQAILLGRIKIKHSTEEGKNRVGSYE